MKDRVQFDFVPKTTDRLPKHDLVFGSPINDAAVGLPIGDGDTGSLIWFEPDGIHIHVNKTDLWDDSHGHSDYLCCETEEDIACLRHGGELVIRFDSPCFDMLYQDVFDARISLTDATMRLRSKTAFSDVKAECFGSNRYKVTALRCRAITPEPQSPTVTLMRWGSKNMWRWYGQSKHMPEAGLDGTETSAQNGRIYIDQTLNGTVFCLGLAVDTDAYVTRVNRHTGQKTFPKTSEQTFTLYWNISLGSTPKNARENAKHALDNAIAHGFDRIHRAHTQEWEAFWNTATVDIPHDYLENLYYLSLYYSNSECRGAYAPHFTNGIWGFRHDFTPWTQYFHYNMQHMYGPLAPSGHCDLMDNYFAMRRRGLDLAKKVARHVKGKNGAFYHDVTDFCGRAATYSEHNTTPGSQLAMMMYRYYRMTGDKRFLRDTALPVMRETAAYYLDMLVKEEDGLYHLNGTSAYEGTPPYRDTITDLSMIRALFTALTKTVDDAHEKAAYTDVLENLPPFITVPMDEYEVEDGKLAWGLGKGAPVAGDGRVLAIGFDGDGNPVRKNHGDPSKNEYGFPDTEMAPLYPAGIFGLKDKGTPLFDSMLNQVRLHHDPTDCMNWCMMPLYLARMGLGDQLYDYMERIADVFMVFPNGFSLDGAAPVKGAPVGTELYDRFKYYVVTDKDTGGYAAYEAYGFRHYDMETLPILAHGVCESLLQSYDGVLRVTPAKTKMGTARFRLYGEGGFCVCGEVDETSCRVTVESLRGEPCRVKLPDTVNTKTVKIFLKNGEEIQPQWCVEDGEERLNLDGILKKGDTVLITDCPEKQTELPKKAEPNPRWKRCRSKRLGTPPVI